MSHLADVTFAPFGVLGPTTLSFAPGLTVVFGRNEAGKSTLLAGLDAVVSGLPRTSVHGVRPTDLGVRFTIATYAVGSVEYRRTPSEVLRADDLTRIDDPWLPAVRGWGPWLATHGLDHAAMREGGRQLFTGTGDLADVIFLSHEGFSARRLRNRLARRAEALFRPRRSAHSLIADAVTALEAARERESRATVDPARIRVLANQVQEALRDEAVARERRDEVSTTVHRLERDISALDYVAAVVRLQGAAADLAAAGLMPIADARRTVDLIADLATVQQEREHLPRDLDAIARQIAASPAADPILDDAEPIDEANRGLAQAQAHRAAAETSRTAEHEARADVVALLERLQAPVPEPESLHASAAALLVGDDVAAGLQARADEAGQARLVWQQAREARREAEAELAQRREELGEAAEVDPAEVTAARDSRDAAWHDVAAALGRVLDDAARNALATRLEQAQQRADEAADRFASDLSAWSRLDARADELARRAQRTAREESTRRDDLEAAERRWSDVAAAAGLPAGLTDEGWSTRASLLEQLAEGLRSWTAAQEQVAAQAAQWSAFAESVATVARRHDVVADVPGQVAQLHDQLQRAREARQELARLRGEHERIAARIAEAADEEGVIAHQLDALVESTHPSSLDGLAELAERTIEHDERTTELVNARIPLRAVFETDAQVDAAIERLAAAVPSDLADEVDERRAERNERIAEYEEARDVRVAADHALREAEEADDAAAAAQEARSARDHLAELVEEYARTVIALRLLDDRLEAQVLAHGSSTLDRAGELLESLTEGRYVALSSREAGDGRRTLRIHRRDREPVTVDALSEGTADQVFLALRLAGLEHRLAQQHAQGVTALPVVLDDVLLAFDDDRTGIALHALAAWAGDRQVILTTHHAHVRAAAVEQGIEVVDLPEPAVIQELGAPAEIRSSARFDAGVTPPAGRATRAEKISRIRQWAPSAGFEISARGRIPIEVEQAFDAAHPDLALP